MTYLHASPARFPTASSHLRTLREDDRPEFDQAVLVAFRFGLDTIDIAEKLGRHQSNVARALARARDAERAV